ncbi:hypothetical protein O3G_MSEX009791 [Manduca sexta]|uniref:Uncharacterized protein n=1 Tax=Manduca sexta TaxID=7130 RepID=A0A922CSA4_MANSE|nr:hypothetical protein O3G_MSEX009791 [Manduca sexta]
MKTFVILFALMAMAAAQGSVNFVDEADNNQQDSGRRGYRPQPAENRLTVTNNGCGVYVVESTHNQGNTITVHPHDGQGSGSVIQIGSSQGCGNGMYITSNFVCFQGLHYRRILFCRLMYIKYTKVS